MPHLIHRVRHVTLSRIARKILPAVAVSLAVLLALEIGFRLWHGVRVLETANFALVPTDIFRARPWEVYDPLLGWRLPDYRAGPYWGGTMATGELGVRMNSNSVEPVPRGAILAVGDSFTVGFGVSDADSWPARLEKLLGRPVVNAGVAGWGVDQTILRAESLVPILRPRSLIVGIFHQDVMRNTFEAFGKGYKPYFHVENGQGELRGTPVPLEQPEYTDDAFRWFFGRSFVVHKLMLRWYGDEWLKERQPLFKRLYDDEKGLEISCYLMDRLVRLRDQYDVEILVLMQYDADAYSQDTPPWAGPQVLACAEERGLATVDSWPLIKRIADSDPRLFRELWFVENMSLGHMSPKGNQLVAKLLRDAGRPLLGARKPVKEHRISRP